ncbi:unnamed protein product [Musa banksii]
MMVADMHPPAPPSSHSPRSNALESLSLSHPVAVEDTSTQPLLPPHPPPPSLARSTLTQNSPPHTRSAPPPSPTHS